MVSLDKKSALKGGSDMHCIKAFISLNSGYNVRWRVWSRMREAEEKWIRSGEGFGHSGVAGGTITLCSEGTNSNIDNHLKPVILFTSLKNLHTGRAGAGAKKKLHTLKPFFVNVVLLYWFACHAISN